MTPVEAGPLYRLLDALVKLAFAIFFAVCASSNWRAYREKRWSEKLRSLFWRAIGLVLSLTLLYGAFVMLGLVPDHWNIFLGEDIFSSI